LTITLSFDGGGPVTAALRGEVDLCTAGYLEEVLDHLGIDGFRQIRVDLSGVDFLAAIGVGALVHAEAVCTQRGGRFTLCKPTAHIRRVLTLTDQHHLIGDT
jgi:anti-anti-sigma factor